MGVITNLIRMNQEKKQHDQDNQLRAFELASKSDDPQLRQWGIQSITDLGMKSAPNPDVKKHIPVLGQMAQVLSGLGHGLKQLNPSPAAPRPPEGPAPKYDPARARAYQEQEEIRQADIDARKHSIAARQAEQDEVVADEHNRQRYLDRLKSAVQSGLMTQADADEAARTYTVTQKPPVDLATAPQQEVHFRAPGIATPVILYRRRDGKLVNVAGKPVEPGQDWVQIDKPSPDKPPTATEEARQDALQSFAEMTGRPADKLTPRERQQATEWAKASPDLRNRTEINIRNGMPFETAWAKAQTDEVKASDLRTQAQQVQIKIATESGKDITDDELRDLAKLAVINKQDPHIVTRNPELNTRYLKIKADVIREGGGAQAVAGGQAEYHASSGALANLVKLQTTMRASLDGTNREIDRLKKLSESIPLTDFARFNSLSQFLSANLSDNPALARYREALLAARYRYNSMISNVRGGGAATNQVRTETAENIINNAMARGALNAAADEMKVGLKNMMDGLNDAVTRTRTDLMKGPGGSDDLKPPKPGATLDADTAKKYLDAAGGDKAKARAAAQTDGWAVK